MKGETAGVALSVEEHLKVKIPSVCDTCCLVRPRYGGEMDNTISVILSFDAESLPGKVKLESVSFILGELM